MTNKQLRQYHNALMLLPANNPARKRGLAEISARETTTDLIIHGKDDQFWNSAAGQPGPLTVQYTTKGLSPYDLYRIYAEQKEDLSLSRISITGNDDQPGGRTFSITWFDEVNTDMRQELCEAACSTLNRTVQSLRDDIAAITTNCPSEMLTKPKAEDRLITAALTHITRWRRGDGNDEDYAVAIRDEIDEYLSFIKDRPADQAPVTDEFPEAAFEELTPDEDPFAGIGEPNDLPY